MITKPTVLVVGAGASIDFGFPSGLQLVQRLIDRGHIDGATTDALRENDFTPEAVGAFSDALDGSQKLSVDVFLANRPDLVPIGKALIAASLIPYELPHGVLRNGPRPSWLQILLERLPESPSEWPKCGLSIVTFNYDRVIEYFLFTALVNGHRQSVDEATNILRNIDIVHVHGALGAFPGLGDSADTRPFDSGVSAGSVHMAAKGIKIIHEGRDDDEGVVLARELIEAAYEVVFLGFGYGAVNMRRLGIPKSTKDKRLRGSAIGMTPREIAIATKRFAGAPLDFQPDASAPSLTAFLRNSGALGH